MTTTKKLLFQTVASHLILQGRPAIREGTINACVYKSSSNLKCAVGFLIKPEFYDPRFEGKKVSDLDVTHAVEKSLNRRIELDEIYLLSSLQAVHDGSRKNEDGTFNVPALFNELNLIVRNHGIE